MLAGQSSMPNKLTPEYWRNHAKEVRMLAEQMTDPQVRETLLRSATDYELLAEDAKERQRPNRATATFWLKACL
jgi:hypothetical protein